MKDRRDCFLSFGVALISKKNFFKVGKKKVNKVKILNASTDIKAE
jgi:hypothetical protein